MKLLELTGLRLVKSGKRRSFGIFECVCGNKTEKAISDVKAGNASHCSRGCIYRKQLKDPVVVSQNILFHRYKSNARIKKIDFNLSKEQFEELTSSPCAYCGHAGRTSPNAHCTTKNPEQNEAFKTLKLNGIDRVDSSIGYELGNVVSCCKICNYGKNDMKIEEWLSYLKDVAKFQLGGLV